MAAVFLTLALANGKQKLLRKNIAHGTEYTTGGTLYLADGTPWSEAIAARSRCAAARELAAAGKKAETVEELACIDAPRGHQLPLGMQGPTERVRTYNLDALPSAKDFWERHVHGSQPAFFPGLALAHPAMKRWATDEALIEDFGLFRVQVEPKVEERISDHCSRHTSNGGWADSRGVSPNWVVPCPADMDIHDIDNNGIMRFDEFLRRYRTEPLYTITQTPRPMNDDVLVPHFVQCGWREAPARSAAPRPWMSPIYEANIWMSFNFDPQPGGLERPAAELNATSAPMGFSRSVLHYDQNHGFMCLYTGRKEWLYVDTAMHIDDVPLWEGNYDRNRPHESRASDDSLIDGEFVDLIKYPRFANVSQKRVMQRPGDCIFTPAKYMHYVRSWGRNIASMWMMQDNLHFNDEGCMELLAAVNDSGRMRANRDEDEPGSEIRARAAMVPEPLSQHDIMWDYPGEHGEPGYGEVKMGWPNWHQQRRHFADMLARREPRARLHLAEFRRLWPNSGADSAFKLLDSSGRGFLQVEDLYGPHSARVFRRVAVDSEGGYDELDEDMYDDQQSEGEDQRQGGEDEDDEEGTDAEEEEGHNGWSAEL